MESYTNPESGSVIRPSIVEAPALLQYHDHNAIHCELLEAAIDLARFTPDQFRVQLTGIPLDGSVPLTMRSTVRTKHNNLSFYAGKEQHDENGYVRLWLHGTNPDDQLEFISQPEPVEFGRNKVFGIQPYGVDGPLRYLNCDDLCMLLDDLIPDVSRRFSALVDPRTEKTFDVIAAALGSILAENAKKSERQQIYQTTDHKMSFLNGDLFDIETSVALELNSKGKEQTCALRVASPVQTDEGVIEQAVIYSFSQQPYKQKGRYQQPFEPTAKIMLSSVEVPSNRLGSYIGDAQANTNTRQVIERGLALLLAEPRAA